MLRRMSRKRCILIMLLALTAAPVSFAQTEPAELRVPTLIPRILEHDSSYRRALLDEAGAAASRSLARARLLPQISLGPGQGGSSYAWQRSEVAPEPTDPGGAGALAAGTQTETETVVQNTHRAGAQLNVTQALPTDGSLSVSTGNTLTARVNHDEDPQFRQDLSFGATWQQPLFVNGRILDLRVFGASVELAGGIPLRLARSSTEMQKNNRIFSAIESYLQVVQLRKQLDVLSRNVETTEERVEQTRIRRRQGTARQRDVWDVETRLDDLIESRLETEYALLQAEASLAASLGISGDLSDQTLMDAVPSLNVPTEAELIEAARQRSGQVRQAREGLSQAELRKIVNGRQYAATLSTSVSVAPSYAQDWSGGGFGSENLGDSYSELFTDDSSWDTTVSVSLQVPIYNGGQARSQATQDEREIEKASLSLSDARRSVEDQIHALYLRRELLEEQLSFRRTSLSLEQDRLDEKQRLAELDSITQLELREAEAQVDARENALWRTRADIFLNGLRILQAAGRDLETVINTNTGS